MAAGGRHTLKVVPRPGHEADLMRQPAMLKGLRKIGQRIQDEAEGAAPRRGSLPTDRERHYADMFDTQVGLDSHGAFVVVNNRHFIALFVEFGTMHSPPHAVLRRALDSARTMGR